MEEKDITKLFSHRLEAWLRLKTHKTFESLNEAFAEKSFAVAILILMSVPALPIPTGGITHVFEIIAMLLAGEIVLGFKAIWLPRRWRQLRPGKVMEQKALPKLIGLISWFEKRFKPHHKSTFEQTVVSRFIGLLIIGFTVTAFFAPPFSGLDTLPSLGVVIICLSIILDNLFLMLIGTLVGALGLAVILQLGKIIVDLFH